MKKKKKKKSEREREEEEEVKIVELQQFESLGGKVSFFKRCG
jgi:predicted HTH domain antitoxin